MDGMLVRYGEIASTKLTFPKKRQDMSDQGDFSPVTAGGTLR